MVVRTRFAPSPTGDLHLGGARTALFAWLYAKHYGGQFILRIEDTDRERSTSESLASIMEAMKWLGLQADEGPYYQSERLDLYQEKLQQLLDENKAYRCTCSKQRLDDLRTAQMAKGEKPRYDGHCREQAISAAGQDSVVRFRMPYDGEIVFNDLVRGQIVVKNSELDDVILARSDGSPTYNFTVVVDDGDMAMTHVLRGDDHISNTPRQIHIMQALGYRPPEYGHMSTILGSDGKRLSKRHGALGVLAYKDQGILPEALLNCLVRLGWSHGDQEIFSVTEMCQLFDLSAVQKSAAAFSEDKLFWLNQQYIMAAEPQSLAPLLGGQLMRCDVAAADIAKGPELSAVVTLLQSRCKTMVAMAEQSLWLYQPLLPYQNDKVSKALTSESVVYLQAVRESFASLAEWNATSIHDAMAQVVSAHEVGFGKLGRPLRAAVTGGGCSADLSAILSLLTQQAVDQALGGAIAWVRAKKSD
jgi:glutamyl-tRNA synthetase